MSEILTKVLEVGKANGYKAYTVDGHDFGYLVTPNGNVLSVCNAQWGTGVIFSLEYKPSQKCGSGCSCHTDTDEHDFGVRNVTERDLAYYEVEGLKFARQLKAPLYKNVDEWLDNCLWNKPWGLLREV